MYLCSRNFKSLEKEEAGKKELIKKVDCFRTKMILRTYWSFHPLVPLIVGWSAICCVTGLMAFLHLYLSLARLIFRCFLRRSALTTSFHFPL